MNALETPITPEHKRQFFDMSDLLARASFSPATWKDIDKEPGIYIVYWPEPTPVEFQHHAGEARYVMPTAVGDLKTKWQRICAQKPTDILYIGKAVDIRKRVRVLARFGVGKSSKHRGGEWLWQVADIEKAKIMTQTCPVGQAEPFESWLLARFLEEHGELSLANRKMPRLDRWRP